jgi:hypothetical protein
MAVRLEAWKPSQDVVLRVMPHASRAVCSMRGETACQTMPDVQHTRRHVTCCRQP